MLLKNKNAVIYGAGGAIGRVVAHTFARQGARVFLAGRTLAKLTKVSEEIMNADGTAYVARVDAFEEREVENHLQAIVEEFGYIDISFNLIGMNDIRGTPLINLSSEDFLSPIVSAMHSHFITATTTALAMAMWGHGIILALTSTGHSAEEHIGGFGVACNAIESFYRQLAIEIGKYGVQTFSFRTNWSQAGNVLEVNKQTFMAGNHVRHYRDKLGEMILPKPLPYQVRIAEAAVFIAAGRVNAITGSVFDVSPDDREGSVPLI